MDSIVKAVNKVVNETLENTVIILSGSEGSTTGRRRLNTDFLNLQQTVSNQTAGNYTNLRINQFLTPNVLTGLLIAIFLFSILLIGFLMLFDVQTPTVFATTSIDFGKIEK